MGVVHADVVLNLEQVHVELAVDLIQVHQLRSRVGILIIRLHEPIVREVQPFNGDIG